jgi:sortase A
VNWSEIANWRPSTERLKRIWPLLFIVAGVVLLAYVAVQYITMYSEQRRLVREWEQQNLSVRSAGVVTTLTRMTIPNIKLDAVVVEGTARKSLLVGPGHITETPQPGELGNSVITGHRDTFFRHIYELSKGDSILVQRAGREFRYQVTGKRVVKPDDIGVLRPTPDSQLTLITCYPTYYIGPAPERLVVFSKLVAQPHTASAIGRESSTQPAKSEP